MGYISKTMHVYRGFHFWTLSSLFNCVAMSFFIFGPSGDSVPHYMGYIISFISLLLLPYGLKRFGKVEDHHGFIFFSILLFLGVTSLLFLLPYSVNENISIAMYFSIIPVFMLSIYYAIHKSAIHNSLRKRLVITTFITGIILITLRLILTILSARSDILDHSYYKQWLNIAIDINSTGIYFGLIILNFRKTEADLRESVEREDVLEGLIPICAECNKIRDDSGYWNQLESYISSHSDAKFSHSICPTCVQKLYPDMIKYKDDGIDSASL